MEEELVRRAAHGDAELASDVRAQDDDLRSLGCERERVGPPQPTPRARDDHDATLAGGLGRHAVMPPSMLTMAPVM